MTKKPAALRRFEVLVTETTMLRYYVYARHAEHARRIWRTTEDDGERGEPEEELLGHRCVSVTALPPRPPAPPILDVLMGPDASPRAMREARAALRKAGA
jgi:hypothetical protein